MSKALAVFYSRKGENHMPGGIQVLEKGHTARAAEFIQKACGADLFEIDTAVPYAENYRECCMQAVQEIKANARPELKGYPEDVSGYDTVFVCFPCWCGTAPMCVFTFLEKYDWTGKRIVPLCTNEGSGLAKAPADLARSCPGATILPGLSVLGHQVKDSEEIIAAWAKEQL
jgi:flavodoxin